VKSWAKQTAKECAGFLRGKKWSRLALFLCVWAGASGHALAGPPPGLVSGGGFPLPGAAGGSTQVTWVILVLLTALTLIPALLVAITPFSRILIVFHFLRQALGTQTVPTNQTVVGLSLFLTYFIMQPVGVQVYDTAIAPLQKGSITAIEAVDLSSKPLRTFMLKFTREQDLALFVELTKSPRPKNPDDLPMRVVIPAYMISELKAGFQIGMVLFLPFLVIDLAVASITTSMGMMQLPPVIISTPLKIVLFVVVDGWHLVVSSLMKSFY
jgi:flagellar biosynthesis protein FliP